MSKLIPSTALLRNFEGHDQGVTAVAVFPDRQRVMGSADKTLRLWDLKTGFMLKKMEGCRRDVLVLMVSRDGQLIASGDELGKVMVWRGETGESLTQPILAHSSYIHSLDFSPDGTVLAGTSAFYDKVKLWRIKTWQQEGHQIRRGNYLHCVTVRYSPSGELLVNDANNYTPYAHCSFIMAQTYNVNCDHTLQDSIKSISIQPSLIYISNLKGIALCINGDVRDARAAFDVASMFTNQDSETIHFFLLIKAITLFNMYQHEEAMLLLVRMLILARAFMRPPEAPPYVCPPSDLILALKSAIFWV